ncbi:MAG: PaaI family thioesterase [Chloroflexi bacterium]|nr:PaaI family thioesterase [Chloroflexota bacterium]
MLPWEKPLGLIDVDIDRRHYQYCFGCGTDNPLGLKLAFKWDGKTARATFTAQKVHQGWPETMHGGLLCALLDEAAGWAVYFQGIRGVTGKLEARLKRPIMVGQTVRVEATTIKLSRKLVQTAAVIKLPDDTIAAEAVATVYIVPQNHQKENEVGKNPGARQA